jgi:hypothetical protein
MVLCCHGSVPRRSGRLRGPLNPLLGVHWGGGVAAGVKRPGREANYSPSSSAEFKNAWSYDSTPHGCIYSWMLNSFIGYFKTLSLAIQSVPEGKVNILGGHRTVILSKEVNMYMCPILNGFRERASSLYTVQTSNTPYPQTSCKVH